MNSTRKIKYKIESSNGNYHELCLIGDYAKTTAHALALDLCKKVHDSRIFKCRMPIYPMATSEFDGRWATYYIVYSGDKFIHEIVVREEYYD